MRSRTSPWPSQPGSAGRRAALPRPTSPPPRGGYPPGPPGLCLAVVSAPRLCRVGAGDLHCYKRPGDPDGAGEDHTQEPLPSLG